MKPAIQYILTLSVVTCLLYLSGCSKGAQQPDFERTLTQAQSYLSSGQIQSTLLESQNLLQINPKSPETYILLGDTLAIVGDYKNAAAQYQKATELSLLPGELSQVQYKRIDALVRLGRLEDAEAELLPLQDSGTPTAKAQRLTGDIALSKGLYDEAILAYNDALAIEPQNSASLLGLAIVENINKNTDAATDWLNQALASKTDYLDAQIFQGYYYLEQAQPDQAEASFSNALAAVRKYDIMTSRKYRIIQGLAKSFVNQGRTEEALRLNKTLAESPQGKVQQGIKNALQAYEQGNSEAAEENFEQVLSMAPGHQLSNLGLGMLKLQDGDIETAEHLFTQATNDLDALNEKAFKAITLARLRLGKTEEALEILQTGLERFPESEDLHVLQASTLASNKRFDTARTTITNVLEKNPSNPDALSLLAHIEDQEGNTREARTLYMKSIQIRPEFFPTYQGFFSSYKGQPREAQRQIQVILSQQKPPALTTEVALGIAHILTQDFISARDLGRRLVKKAPNNLQVKRLASTALYSTALEDYKNQRLQPAYIQLKEAIQLYPSEKSVTLLTRLAVELQRPDEAVQVIQNLIEKEPNFALGSELLGDLAMVSNKNAEAITYFEKAWSIRPSFRLSIKLFKLKKANQNLEQALSHITKWHSSTEIALEQNPSDQRLLNTLESSLFALATAHEQHQNNTQAIAFYQKLLQLKPQSPMYLNNMAWLKFVENETDAVTFAEKAYKLAPETGEIIDTYAWILVQQGDTEKGIELLKMAVTKSPNNPMIKQHLDQATAMKSKSI